MSLHDRAAQFAPFAALTGFGGTIAETGRLTEERIELDESAKEALNARLRMIQEHIAQRPEITFLRFVPDGRKAGGAYEKITGQVRRLDELERAVVLCSGEILPVEDILAIEGTLFRDLRVGEQD